MILNLKIAQKPALRYYLSAVNNQARECFVKDLGNNSINKNDANLPENGLSKIILNRPEKMNSIGKQILSELGECIEYVSNKRYIKCYDLFLCI